MQVPDLQRVESSSVLELQGLQGCRILRLQVSMVPKLQDFRFQTNSATRFQRLPQMRSSSIAATCVKIDWQKVNRKPGRQLVGQTGFESHGGTANQPDSTRYCLYLGVHRSPRKLLGGTFVLVAANF